MIHLSEEELGEIRRRLHDPTSRGKLERVQTIVCEQFEKLKSQAETMVIRTILPRSEIKNLDSVVRKILGNRAGGAPAYSFDDIDDLIGLKILCPYPSDVREVIHSLKSHSGFRVSPLADEDARREKPHGYRGYHYAVELKGPLLAGNEDLMGIKCEVQIKTMLEEAWDSKTHGVSYKREEEIHPDLVSQMRLLSDALNVLDRQSEIVKTQIQQGAMDEKRRKDSVVAVQLGDALELLETMVGDYRLPKEIAEGKFDEANLRLLLPAIEEYRAQGKITKELCYVATLVAMYVRGQQLDAMALALCDELIGRGPDGSEPYLTKGHVCWALDLLDEAIEITETGIAKALAANNDQQIAKGKGDLAYWVAEKAWKERQKGILPELIARARQYIEEAITLAPDGPGFKDTKGFLLIATGTEGEEIEQGRTLIREVSRGCQGTRWERLAKSFYERHERIALMRLLERTNKRPPR